jgi:hypothetical protein
MGLALLVGGLLLAAGCSKGATRPGEVGPPAGTGTPPPVSAPTSHPTTLFPGTLPPTGVGTPLPGPSSSQDQPAATEDDLETFAYGTIDTAALTAEVTAMAGTASALYEHAVARDLDAVETDAQALLEQGNQLEGDAGSATNRMDPLEPADDILAGARGNALVAFGLTQDCAQMATDLAEAALELDLQGLVMLGQQATDLIGITGDLTASYSALLTELERWATANPVDAGRALSQYA